MAMRPPFYIRQLRHDLDDWIAKGWVPAESRAKILDAVGDGKGMSLAAILGVLGVILIGAAAMSYVAANWAGMDKLARLVVLFGGMALAFGLAAALSGGRSALSQAFVLLGVLLFGADIMLVAQTYHINTHYPDGILLWAGGALLAAGLVPSRASLAVAIALGALWTGQEHFEFDQLLHLQYLPFWAVCAGLSAWFAWRPGIHMSALALIFWVIIGFSGLQVLLRWSEAEMASIFVFAPLAIWAAAASFKPKSLQNFLTVEHYAFLLFMAALALLHLFDTGYNKTGILQTSWFVFATLTSLAAVALTWRGAGTGSQQDMDIGGVGLTAIAGLVMVMVADLSLGERQLIALVLTLPILIWAIARGQRLGDSFSINWALFGFGVWVLYAYFAVFGSFMDQTLFLGVGGLLLIGLSVVLDRVRRQLTKPGAPAVEPGAAS
jgi:uncharacterized membrane protein